MKVVEVDVASLTEDPANVNQHPARSIEAIKGSLQRFGQVEPLVVQDGIVYGGNGRLRAMKELGWEVCSVHEFTGSKTEATALAIALNRSAQFSDFDSDALAVQLDVLKDEFELDTMLGFNKDDIAKLNKSSDDEPVPVDIPSLYQVIVDCESEAYQREVVEQLAELGIECKVLVI